MGYSTILPYQVFLMVNKLESFFRGTRRFFECYYPLLGAILCAILLYVESPLNWLSTEFCFRLSSVSLSILAIFVGFLFASVSLLFSIGDKPFIRGMVQSGAFRLLLRYHFWGMAWCVYAMALSVAIVLYPPIYIPLELKIFLVSVCVGAILAAFRVIRLVFKVAVTI